MSYWERLKHKYLNIEMVWYVIFGTLATIVDLGSYSLFNYILGFKYVTSNIMAWVVTVLFAYITNKLFVFKNYVFALKPLLKEFSMFVLARFLSLVYSVVWQIAAVEWINMHDFTAKAWGVIVVALINYFASKLIIFRKKEEESDGDKQVNSGDC